MSAASASRPGPLIRAGSTKELLDSPGLDEVRREREGAEARRPSVTEDKAEPERNRVREAGERRQHVVFSSLEAAALIKADFLWRRFLFLLLFG